MLDKFFKLYAMLMMRPLKESRGRRRLGYFEEFEELSKQLEENTFIPLGPSVVELYV